MTWDIWIVSPFTGNPYMMVDSYSNRGHAVARIRGLRRAAQCSEVQYSLRRGF